MKRNKYCVKKSSLKTSKKPAKPIKKSSIQLPDPVDSTEQSQEVSQEASLEQSQEVSQETSQEQSLEQSLKESVASSSPEIPTGKVIRVTTSHQKKMQKIREQANKPTIVINKVSRNAPVTNFDVEKVPLESSSLEPSDLSEQSELSIEVNVQQNISEYSDDATSTVFSDQSETNQTTSSDERKKPNKAIIKLAIKILQEIDPKRKMNLNQVEEILNERIHSTNDLIEISAIEHLLDSFDTIENQREKAKLKKQDRKIQEKTLKAKRIDKKVFDSRIDLTLPKKDRKPDENDRIFKTGKDIYKGTQQKYRKPVQQDKKKVQQFKKFTKLKKNDKAMKEFNI